MAGKSIKKLIQMFLNINPSEIAIRNKIEAIILFEVLKLDSLTSMWMVMSFTEVISKEWELDPFWLLLKMLEFDRMPSS